jgi:sugar-specific transcriptional regulator TrmB
MVSGQMALGDEQNTRGGDESVAENSGAQQILQTGKSNKVEGNKEVDGRPVSQENAPDGSSGELEESKKNPALNAETQDINTGPSHASKDQSLDKSNAEVDGSGDVDVESFGEYFAYRTKESFHARSYDAAIWDSDGENDKSYYTPTLGSEPDSEGSDDADDEGSECTSSHDYDYASTEELLSELKNENQRADSPGLLTRNPSGQVRNLTLDDVNDLLYTAVNVISGEDFIQLRPIKTLLENLNEVELLDATWRSLENWEGQSPNLYSRQMRFLLATVQNLNNFLASESDDLISLFAHHHLTMALRKDDLDQTLQRMQKKGDWRLRDLLKSLLKSWDGEKCMELLSNELLELAPEEFDSMLQEAFDVVHSDSNLLGTVR